MKDELIFRCIVVALFLGARYVRWHARKDLGWQASWPSMKQHPRDTTVLILLSLCWVTATVIFLLSPQWVAAFRVPLPSWARWCAVAAAFGGLALLRWSDHWLGKNLSVTLKIREGHTLVTSGPYRWVRHPVYTSTIFYSIAMGTITANWLLAALFVVPMVTLVLQRMGPEEQMMIDQFGDDYRQYMAHTGRLLPPLRRRTSGQP